MTAAVPAPLQNEPDPQLIMSFMDYTKLAVMVWTGCEKGMADTETPHLLLISPGKSPARFTGIAYAHASDRTLVPIVRKVQYPHL